jgi:hypothetical protein
MRHILIAAAKRYFQTAMLHSLVLGQQTHSTARIDTFDIASLDVRRESAMLWWKLSGFSQTTLSPRPNKAQAGKFQRNEELKK